MSSDDQRDAIRYRKLRAQHWFDGIVAVVPSPKEAVKLGHDTLSADRLDLFVDGLPDLPEQFAQSPSIIEPVCPHCKRIVHQREAAQAVMISTWVQHGKSPTSGHYESTGPYHGACGTIVSGRMKP